MTGRTAFVVFAGLTLVLLLLALLSVLAGDQVGDLWHAVRTPLLVLATMCALVGSFAGACCARRLRNRAKRHVARYQLVLSQADEASFEEAAAAMEQLVQVVRESLTTRLVAGQPWLALESWFLPPRRDGETGTSAFMLVCEPRTRERALAALRRAYPDLGVRTDPRRPGGEPLEFVAPSFEPVHVLRVHKQRAWALTLGATAGAYDGAAGRSPMAGVVRQQQQVKRLSCVRWCLLPAPDHLDSRASDHLERLVGGDRQNAARSAEVQTALQAAGGAMAYLEVQAAIGHAEVVGLSGRVRSESFGQRQSLCRDLLSPVLSQRGRNHLTERLMVFRQRLYARRWPRAEPPLLPDATRSTLVSPRELALVMRLPALGSEHALPLQRNTVPNLPIPIEVPRARVTELPHPEDVEDAREEDDEVVDAELVWDEG